MIRYASALAVSALMIALLALLPLLGCSSSPATSQKTPQPESQIELPKEIELTILHTNDGHGYVDPCG